MDRRYKQLKTNVKISSRRCKRSQQKYIIHIVFSCLLRKMEILKRENAGMESVVAQK